MPRHWCQHTDANGTWQDPHSTQSEQGCPTAPGLGQDCGFFLSLAFLQKIGKSESSVTVLDLNFSF